MTSHRPDHSQDTLPLKARHSCDETLAGSSAAKMISQQKYLIFLSSTFEDLREERDISTRCILSLGNFPSGMELFPASNDAQWEVIKLAIEDADYFVVIVAGRYGTIASTGVSYTEMEYDYAVQNDIPVLGFVRDNIDEIPAKFTEQSSEKKRKLLSFREKVMSRTCMKFSSPSELAIAVTASLAHAVRVLPRPGWIRADLVRNEHDNVRKRMLVENLEQARRALEVMGRDSKECEFFHDGIAKE